jgi:hypothetical protein
VFQIQVRSEADANTWHPLDAPYRRLGVAVDEAIALADRYSLHGHIQVVPVEG